MMNAWSDVAILEGVRIFRPKKQMPSVGWRNVHCSCTWMGRSFCSTGPWRQPSRWCANICRMFQKKWELDYRVDQRQTLQTSGRLMIYMNNLRTFGVERKIKKCLVGGLPNADPYADIDTSKVLDAGIRCIRRFWSWSTIEIQSSSEWNQNDSNDERFLDQALMKIIQANLPK
jgi:hypothetical protein